MATALLRRYFQMVNTSEIRRQLLRLTFNFQDEREAELKRLEFLSESVMDLCDAYEEISSMDKIITAGEDSVNHSFAMIERLRKNLQ